MTSPPSLLAPLKQYWGYDSFRPLQERIVTSLLGGKDTCVVMPTGGGKSLCYQLPAALLPQKTAIVISPLIALMQDQVAQLEQMGIASAALNSTMAAGEQQRIQRRATEGHYRLLYLSPERLARGDSLDWLARIPTSFFVIDEAHCISEWGHEFRPEYRQLSRLRARFAQTPIAAFTASATRRVRHDIIAQLKLREPDKYIASFHRPNLRYAARQCSAPEQSALLLKALRSYPEGNVILYGSTIAQVETTVDWLEEQSIPAVAYHGQMDAPARQKNQERWMSDGVRVLVGTLAFGLGINKAAVRAVLHLSLPKSLEQFYQEAGRAGRDGEPSDCVVLWQKKDAGTLTYFINQISDPAEKSRAWDRYHEIRNFAEGGGCRHLQVCKHFGETPKWQTCGMCDGCGNAPAWLAEPLEAPRRASKLKRGRGGLATASAKPSHAGAGGNERQRTLVEPPAASGSEAAMRSFMREWRREEAKRLGIPAFMILHDSSLEDLCRVAPRTLEQVRGVSGFGERKTATYGKSILEALERFKNGARASGAAADKVKPAEETAQLLAEGRTFAEIAQIRGRTLGTVVNMVAELVECGDVAFNAAWIPAERYTQIEAAIKQLGMKALRPIKEALPETFTYDEIRLVAAHLRHADQASHDADQGTT